MRDDDVIKAIIAELNSNSPKFSLLLSTSVSGMGFDPQQVTRVVHVCVHPVHFFNTCKRFEEVEDVDKH